MADSASTREGFTGLCPEATAQVNAPIQGQNTLVAGHGQCEGLVATMPVAVDVQAQSLTSTISFLGYIAIYAILTKSVMHTLTDECQASVPDGAASAITFWRLFGC